MITGYDTDQASSELLGMLTRYIKAKPYEKHPKAMMNIFFQRAADKVLGKNYAKERISQRKQEKIYKEILRQLRGTYGRWVNLTNFKVKKTCAIHFACNLPHAFRTDFGPVFAPHSVYMAKDVFYTAHCFERFEERVDPVVYDLFRKPLVKYLKTEPTYADTLMAAADQAPGEWASDGDIRYLNVGAGIVVLDEFPEFYIAKTFLSPGMGSVRTWKSVSGEGRPWERFKSLRELFAHPSDPIPGPIFDTDWLDLMAMKEGDIA